MNDVFLQRAIGAGVVFTLLFAITAMLPSPNQSGPPADVDEQRVQIDLRTPPRYQRDEPVRVASPKPAAAKSAPAHEPERKPEPGPEAGSESEPKPEPKPEVKPDPKPEPKPKSTPAGKPVPSGDWRVQVASFSEIERARRVIGEFGQAGLPAFRESVSVGGRKVHRVILGPFDTEAAARGARARAVMDGFADARIQRLDDAP